VVSALCYLDRLQYIIHRDVAARNFLVSRHKSVKLADFGRARHVHDDCYQASRSELVVVKWASPEVLLRSRYSTGSDLWAGAVTMWEVLTRGQRPYGGLSAEQCAVYVLNGGRLERPDDCPSHLYSALGACWRHSADDRPTATQLARRLDEISLTQLQSPVMSLPSHRRTPTSSSSATGVSSSRVSPGPSPSLSAGSHRSPLLSMQLPKRRRDAWTDLEAVDECYGISSSSLSSLSSEQRQQGDITASGSADDLVTRGDKIRRSLHKLVNMSRL